MTTKTKIKTTTYWIRDSVDSWEEEIPSDADPETWIRENTDPSDWQTDPDASVHLQLDYGTSDDVHEDEESGVVHYSGPTLGSLTITQHPAEWADGEGWEYDAVHGNRGGVITTWRKGDRVAKVDSWWQYPDTGMVCDGDHVTIQAAE